MLPEVSRSAIRRTPSRRSYASPRRQASATFSATGFGAASRDHRAVVIRRTRATIPARRAVVAAASLMLAAYNWWGAAKFSVVSARGSAQPSARIAVVGLFDVNACGCDDDPAGHAMTANTKSMLLLAMTLVTGFSLGLFADATLVRGRREQPGNSVARRVSSRNGRRDPATQRRSARLYSPSTRERGATE